VVVKKKVDFFQLPGFGTNNFECKTSATSRDLNNEIITAVVSDTTYINCMLTRLCVFKLN
jgi:hypothetical protein